MNEQQRKAMELALEAAYLAGFNASGEGYNGEYPFDATVNNPAENNVWTKDRDNYIKEALAQPEQEPDLNGVAIVGDLAPYRRRTIGLPDTAPLYTTPPQRTWVGLTFAEVKHMLELFVVPPHHVEMVVQAIEAKLKEKNT